MNIENLIQFQQYYAQLPWYKRFFLFPWSLSTQLVKNSLNQADFCNTYDQIHASWRWRFYVWFFPELDTFNNSEAMVRYRDLSGSELIEQAPVQPHRNLFFDLPFSELNEYPSDLETDLQSHSVAYRIRSAYQIFNIPQPNQAICQFVRLNLSAAVWRGIDEWPMSFQTLESSGLLTPDQETNFLSSSQRALLKALMGSYHPKKLARFTVKLNEINELTDDNISAMTKNKNLFSPDILVSINEILEQTPKVNKRVFINFLVRRIQSDEDAKAIIPLSDLLKKCCELEQSFDLISDKLGQDDSQLHVYALTRKLQKSCVDYNHSDYDVIPIELREQLMSSMSMNKALFTSDHAPLIFDIIINTSSNRTYFILSLMRQIYRLTLLTDNQKTSFYVFWKKVSVRKFLSADEKETKHLFHIENCIQLCSRLDCINNPSNLNHIMLLEDFSDSLFTIRRILDFFNEYSSRSDIKLVQSDFDELISRDDAQQIDYMRKHLNLGTDEQDKLIDTLKYERFFRELSASHIFDHYSLTSIAKFMSDVKDSYPPAYLVSFMEAMHLLSKSALILKATQYDTRDWFVTIMLDLIKAGASPSVAYTSLIHLARLKLLDAYTHINLLLYKIQPYLHEMLSVWFGSEELCDLWTSISKNKFGHREYYRLINDCQNILEGNKLRKHEAVYECVRDRLISIELSSNCTGLTNAQLRARLESIPKKVKTLHLDESSFSAKTESDLISLFFMLPVQVFLLQYNRKIERSMNILIAQHLMTQVKHIIDQQNTKLDFSLVHFPVDIDDTNLSVLISILEQQNDPLAYLCCALLLMGNINNNIEPESCGQAREVYNEKRVNDAIRFYDRAATNAQLKPLIDFLLWEIKTVIDYDSVKNRLIQYDLSPYHFVSDYSQYAKRDHVSIPMGVLAINLSFFKKFEKRMLSTKPHTVTERGLELNITDAPEPEVIRSEIR